MWRTMRQEHNGFIDCADIKYSPLPTMIDLYRIYLGRGGRCQSSRAIGCFSHSSSHKTIWINLRVTMICFRQAKCCNLIVLINQITAVGDAYLGHWTRSYLMVNLSIIGAIKTHPLWIYICIFVYINFTFYMNIVIFCYNNYWGHINIYRINSSNGYRCSE